MSKVQLSKETQEIWDQIKRLPTPYFGLKGKVIEDIASPVNIDQFKLFLNVKASSAIASIEESLSGFTKKGISGDDVPKYAVESIKGMVVVSLNKEF